MKQEIKAEDLAMFKRTEQHNYVIWDAMMSSGKTQRIISYMLNIHNKGFVFGAKQDRFIYVSPYLAEAHRIAATTSIGEAKTAKRVEGKIEYDESLPQAALKFCHPTAQNKDGSKITGFVNLIENQANIVSTHTLLKSLSSLNVDVSNYTLIIDEALEPYEVDATISGKELERFIKNNILSLDDDEMTLRFHRENFGRDGGSESVKDTRFEDFAEDCDKGLMFKVGGRVYRQFDLSLIGKFKRVIGMTYNYKGSAFDLLLQNGGINPHIEYFGKTVDEIKSLIKLNVDRKMNAVGVSTNPKTMIKDGNYPVLTKAYFEKDSEGKKVAFPNITKYFYNQLYNMWLQRENIPVERRLWTCYLDDKDAISKGSGRTNRFGTQWIAFNTRATNDYDETDHLAFLINPYRDPSIIKLLSSKGVKMGQDHYSLNILIQWMFRSALRQGKEINLYLPSQRMKDLLNEWLDGEVLTYAKED